MSSEAGFSRRHALMAAGAGTFTATTFAGRPSTVDAAAHVAADSIFNVIEDFGATGGFFDQDDTAAIQAAIDAAIAAGGGTVWLPIGTYRITSKLKLTGTSATAPFKPIRLQGTGSGSKLVSTNSKIIQTGEHEHGDPDWQFSGNRLLEANGSFERHAETNIVSAVEFGSFEVEVPSTLANNLNVGDFIALEEEITSGWVYGDADNSPTKPFEVHQVVTKKGAGGTLIGLGSATVHSYTSAATAYKFTPVEGLEIRDIAITAAWDPPPHQGIYSLIVHNAAKVAIDNVLIQRAAGGIIIKNVIDAHITNCTVDGLPKYETVQPGPRGSTAHSAPYGYGVAVCGASANISIIGLVGRNTRHLFTTLSDQRSGEDQFYGGPRNVTIMGGIGDGGNARDDTHETGSQPKSIWDTHSQGTDIAFIGCSAIGLNAQNFGAFQIRAKNCRIIDCTAKHNAGHGVKVHQLASEVVVQGGEFSFNGKNGIGGVAHQTTVADAQIHHNGERGVLISGGTRLHVTNCYIYENGSEGIRDQADTGEKCEEIVITGNIVPKGTNGAQDSSVTGVGGGGVVIANNIFLGYGTGDDGTWSVNPAVSQNNIVDP